MRAIDREAKRSQARRVAYERSAQKIALLEEAADAADEYQQMIDQLVGAHRIAFRPVDWEAKAQCEPLPMPERTSVTEEAARRAAGGYHPNWFDRTFGLARGKVARLESAVAHAVIHDEAMHRAECGKVRAVNDGIELARKLIALDRDAVAKVVNEQSGLGDLPFCVEALDLWFGENRQVIARVDGLDLEDMPTQSVTLLQSGKASVKPLSPAKIQELHRANICASALRVAVELLKVVPVPMVEVVMETDLLDPATGHIEPKPVLSVKVSRQAIATLALERTEAPAVVERLGGEMDWNSRRGFAAIADGCVA
ncbi:hypothetical protein [Brevundimonas sp.]|uniref:hypothetical protein n=1 Tax=Brevundimonas sp. TaxID=1871086 RepID=UPI002D403C1E|nr:hypothetical protein [Brevundimonas sp.]HYC98228.1 hypothetical protein [Brevundimonas sp.]